MYCGLSDIFGAAKQRYKERESLLSRAKFDEVSIFLYNRRRPHILNFMVTIGNQTMIDPEHKCFLKGTSVSRLQRKIPQVISKFRP